MTNSEVSDLTSVEDEAIRICQELIRIPSVNYGEGKGDESAVAAYVVASLAEVGIAAKIYESAPNRCNVIARISGTDSSRPGLVVHGHIDVVPANAAEWSVDPFGGIIKDEMIWGRGAVDMKNTDAMILAIVRDWARRGYKAAQKGIHWMKLTAQGRAGHGSMMNDENAVTALTEAVAKIGRYEWPQRYTQTVKDLFREVARVTGKAYDEKDLRPLLKEIGSTARMIGATLQNTANPTMLEAGYKANVIPGSASAVIDGRFLPGYEEELNTTIRAIIGPDIEIETISHDIALEVNFNAPLVEAMKAALLREDPEGIPVPYLMSGGTDNKALSELGIIGYGFSPLRLPADLDFMSLFHGVDERVPIDGIRFGVRVLADFLEHA